jgi:hypothetical protein
MNKHRQHRRVGIRSNAEEKWKAVQGNLARLCRFTY